MLEENKALHDKDNFSERISKQMQLPIELAGGKCKNPVDVMNPALIGGMALAYQGFATFLPEDDSTLKIDWDESKMPTFMRLQKAFKQELNKSESLEKFYQQQL